jgi:hypothetical protein
MTELKAQDEAGVYTAVMASVFDTLRVGLQVVAPTLVTGVIKRRPKVMALADRLQLDRSGIRLMRSLRRKYGAVPLVCPGRNLVRYTTGMMLANLWQSHAYELQSPSTLDSSRPIPATQDNFGLGFGVLTGRAGVHARVPGAADSRW